MEKVVGVREVEQQLRKENETLKLRLESAERVANRTLARMQSEIDRLQGERNKAIEWVKGAVAELNRLEAKAWRKWEHDADMYAQGEAGAYDASEQMMIAILKGIGESL